MLKQVWARCIHILVILWQFFVYFIYLEPFKSFFQQLCPSYKSLTSYICVRDKFEDFYVSCMQILVILWPFQLKFINFECVKWFFQQFVYILYQVYLFYVCKKQVQGLLW